MNISMPYPARYALKKLTEAGFQALLVGGCVRDSLLGKQPSDFDITTSALPEEVLAVFKRDHTLTTGLKHGTITLIKHATPVEITTFRIDGEYADNRHPEEVVFTTDLHMDMLRRDLTINAMCWDEHAGLIDYVGGEEDLEERIVRCVGEPDVRFTEDALRIMRALRFSSTLDFDIEEETGRAALRQAELLNNVARERIHTELLKLLAGQRPERILLEYRKVFEVIIPALSELSEDEYMVAVRRTALVPAHAELRLAALLASLGAKRAEDICIELRLGKRVRALVGGLIGHMADPLPSDRVAMRRAYGAQGDLLPALIELQSAHARALCTLVIQKSDCVRIDQLAINGNDLKEMKVGSRHIGRLLKELLDGVIEGRLLNTPEELNEYVQQDVERRTRGKKA